VSSGTHYIRLTYIAEYIDWLAVRLVERDGQGVRDNTLESIRAMTHNLRLRRPRKRSPSRTAARTGLLPQEQGRLLDIVRPDSTDSPFRPSLRKRNELMVFLLYYLGIRAGELLAIKVSDFDFQRNEICNSKAPR
jgi:integrase